MNTNLTIRTEATLQDTKFADLATIYNEFATELDIKPIKKFRDKPTGIKRVLDIQAKYSEALSERAKSKTPTSKSAAKSEKSTRSDSEYSSTNSFSMNVGGSRIVYDIPTTLVTVVKTTDKEGSIRDAYQKAISNSLSGTMDEVIEEFKKIMPSTPKSGELVDKAFVIRRLKRLVNKGFFKFEQL